jgi:hypothetical protein
MDSKKMIVLAREIFSDEPNRSRNTRWWLFEHGTIVLVHLQACGETQVLREMELLAEALGPYEGQGSVYGDVNPMPLIRHERTWLVTYPFTACIVTLVDADDFQKKANRPPTDEVVQTSEGARRAQDAVGDLRAGLCARMKRNRDARERKIVASSESGGGN